MSSTAVDRINGARSSLAIKAPCVVASIANLTLSGEQTIDGVAVLTGDRVLVRSQTSGVDNGIYVADTGTWERAPDADGNADWTAGTLVKVNNGTTTAGFWYLTTTGTIIVGTTSIAFANASTVLAVVSAFMQTVLAATTASSAFALLAAAGISLTGDISPVALSANTDDWAPANFATASTIRMDMTAAWNLTGIAGGSDGRLICLHNVSAFVATLKDNATSTAANRFQLTNDYTLAADSSVLLEYDSTSARWRLFGQQTTVSIAVNGLIDGGMEIWQRGTPVAVAASSNGYGPDRWALTTGANQACVMTQAAGLTSGSQYACAVQRNAAQTGVGTLYFEQAYALEEIIKWRGQTVSVSTYLSTGANWSPAAGALTMAIYCGTGSAAKRGAGAYAGETTPLTSALAISSGTGAAQYSATATAIIPVNTTQMSVVFSWVPTGIAGAADTLTVDDVMLSATAGVAYERRMQSDELLRCQPYFEKSFALGTTPAQNIGANTGDSEWVSAVAATNTTYGYIPFKVRKRTAPTIVTFSTQAASAQAYDQIAAAACTGTAVQVLLDTGFRVSAVVPGGGLAGDIIAIHWTASAEI